MTFEPPVKQSTADETHLSKSSAESIYNEETPQIPKQQTSPWAEFFSYRPRPEEEKDYAEFMVDRPMNRLPDESRSPFLDD